MYDSNENLKTIFDKESLLEILLEFEEIFDRLNMYSYENWCLGEIVYGPRVKKYWVQVILKYDYKKMPDPRGGMVLVKHGIKVEFKKDKEDVPVNIKTNNDYEEGTRKPKMESKDIWLVRVTIPRRLIDIIDQDFEFNDEKEELSKIEIKNIEDQGNDQTDNFDTGLEMDDDQNDNK